MEKKIEFQYRNILKSPLSEDELYQLAGLGDTTAAGLINKGSKAFKNLNVDLSNLSEEEAAHLISANPKIMIRPLFSDGTRLAAGFKEEVIERTFLEG